MIWGPVKSSQAIQDSSACAIDLGSRTEHCSRSQQSRDWPRLSGGCSAGKFAGIVTGSNDRMIWSSSLCGFDSETLTGYAKTEQEAFDTIADYERATNSRFVKSGGWKKAQNGM